MKKTICLYFQVHQPFRLRRYRFFEMGDNHYYFDDYLNESITHKIANKCYLPANKMLLKLIEQYPDQFKISFSISGTALDHFELYAPEVLESFKAIAQTGNVEFLSETYYHSLAALASKDEFAEQIEMHTKAIQELFNQTPKVFRNTELIYSNQIGESISDMGFKGILTEGAQKILHWRSPNYLYHHNENANLKMLLKNYKLSDDIAFRFSNQSWEEYPLTKEKYSKWLEETDGELLNLFMDYETFGEHQWKETGIFNFFSDLIHDCIQSGKFEFLTPSQVIEKHDSKSQVDVPQYISWADEQRDLTAWLGDALQNEAYKHLYSLESKVKESKDARLTKAWRLLQTSDHFYYMCTKWASDGDVHAYFNPYDSPYDAFINYMNVLNDFKITIDNYNINQKQSFEAVA